MPCVRQNWTAKGVSDVEFPLVDDFSAGLAAREEPATLESARGPKAIRGEPVATVETEEVSACVGGVGDERRKERKPMGESSCVVLNTGLKDAELAWPEPPTQKITAWLAVFTGKDHAVTFKVIEHCHAGDKTHFFGVFLRKIEDVGEVTDCRFVDAHVAEYRHF
jgi:hypothetical protein